MAYYFYLDKMMLPVTPSKLTIKVENQNKTINLINDGEVNLLKKAGLTNIEFEALIPAFKYPFATYTGGFKSTDIFLKWLELLKVSQNPFQFIVTRGLINGNLKMPTNMKVALEDYKIKEDAKQGLDIVVSIKLKQYRSYGTKIVKVTPDKKKIVENVRDFNHDKITIGSNVMVNGRLHRDSYGGGAGQTRTNYKGKINFIKPGRSHPYHVTTADGSWLGWVTKDSVKGV